MQRTLVFLTFMFCSIFINATENRQDKTAIQSLIAKIKQSSSEDKRELMNQLKITLRKMNLETRKKVMQDLQKTFAMQKNKQPETASAMQSTEEGSMMGQTATIPQNPVMQSRPVIPQNTQFRGGK